MKPPVLSLPAAPSQCFQWVTLRANQNWLIPSLKIINEFSTRLRVETGKPAVFWKDVHDEHGQVKYDIMMSEL
jgi:hypothetical protein